jgi:hypothetical protein
VYTDNDTNVLYDRNKNKLGINNCLDID